MQYHICLTVDDGSSQRLLTALSTGPCRPLTLPCPANCRRDELDGRSHGNTTSYTCTRRHPSARHHLISFQGNPIDVANGRCPTQLALETSWHVIRILPARPPNQPWTPSATSRGESDAEIPNSSVRQPPVVRPRQQGRARSHEPKSSPQVPTKDRQRRLRIDAQHLHLTSTLQSQHIRLRSFQAYQ